MRIILLAISAATLVSAGVNKGNDSGNGSGAGTNNGVGKKMKTIKRPRKAVLANDASPDNACFLSDADFTRLDGVLVMNGDEPPLGKMFCKQTECGYGEIGQGAIQCDISGINDAENENLDDSCGGGGFSVSYLLGQEEVAMESGVAVFPSTCRCNSCDCPGAKGGNPCEGGCQEKNGKHGGYVCTGQKQKKER